MVEEAEEGKEVEEAHDGGGGAEEARRRRRRGRRDGQLACSRVSSASSERAVSSRSCRRLAIDAISARSWRAAASFCPASCLRPATLASCAAIASARGARCVSHSSRSTCSSASALAACCSSVCLWPSGSDASATVRAST